MERLLASKEKDWLAIELKI